MKILSKFTWLPMLPNIPATKQPSKSSKIYSGILYFLILSFSTYTYEHIPSSIYFVLLALFLYIFISYQSYIEYHPIAYKDLKLRRFIGFNATLQDVIEIWNPPTAYKFQIQIQTDEPIPHDQQQLWWITPSLYPINLKLWLGQKIYVESLANTPFIFTLQLCFTDRQQNTIFLTDHDIKHLNTQGKYKKLKYNKIQKVELDSTQNKMMLSIWIKEQNIQILLDEQQLKIMENLLFPRLFMFSYRKYLEIKNHQTQGILWQS